MCCQRKTLAKCQVALFEACVQLFGMASISMTIPYLHFMLDASYYHVAMVFGCSFLATYACLWLKQRLDCCNSSGKCLLATQVLISVTVMIGSFMAFLTIHIWPNVHRNDSQALIIGLAAMFCSLEMSAFGFFISRLGPLFRLDQVTKLSMENLGDSFGAAVWTGLLWLPIDFPTQAYWLFGMAGAMVFLLTCLILIGFCWLSCKKDEAESPISPPPPSSDPSKNPDNTSSPSSSEVQDIGCCGRIRTFGCWIWLSWSLALLSSILIEPIPYFLTDWPMSCGDFSCLPDSGFFLYDVAHPIRIYSYLSITMALVYLFHWVSRTFCNSFFGIIALFMAVLAMGILDIALFAIGYTGNQPWWTILLFVSSGFHPLVIFSVHIIALSIYDRENKQLSPSSNSGGQFFNQFFSMLKVIGLVLGTTLISSIVENSDYAALFRLLSILVLLTWILMVSLSIRICLSKSSNAGYNKIDDHENEPNNGNNDEIHKARPRMIFKNSIKPA
jgi:hypothetical protein